MPDRFLKNALEAQIPYRKFKDSYRVSDSLLGMHARFLRCKKTLVGLKIVSEKTRIGCLRKFYSRLNNHSRKSLFLLAGLWNPIFWLFFAAISVPAWLAAYSSDPLASPYRQNWQEIFLKGQRVLFETRPLIQTQTLNREWNAVAVSVPEAKGRTLRLFADAAANPLLASLHNVRNEPEWHFALHHTSGRYLRIVWKNTEDSVRVGSATIERRRPSLKRNPEHARHSTSQTPRVLGRYWPQNGRVKLLFIETIPAQITLFDRDQNSALLTLKLHQPQLFHESMRFILPKNLSKLMLVWTDTAERSWTAQIK